MSVGVERGGQAEYPILCELIGAHISPTIVFFGQQQNEVRYKGSYGRKYLVDGTARFLKGDHVVGQAGYYTLTRNVHAIVRFGRFLQL